MFTIGITIPSPLSPQNKAFFKNPDYADDIDILGENRDDVRRLCGELLITARRVGLKVNEEKTEYFVIIIKKYRQTETARWTSGGTKT